MADVNPNVATIDRILALAPANTLSVDGFTYLDKDKSLTLHKPPVPTALAISTLTGFVDLLEAGFEAYGPQEVLVHVLDHDTVELIASGSDSFGRRQVYIHAAALKPERTFKFNNFLVQEEFNIALQSMFVPDSNVAELLAISGNLTAQNSSQQEDDGVTQRMTVKAGIVKLDTVTPKPRVSLCPYRTFAEVLQPPSDYIFRVRQSEQGNTCALFEADGGRWKSAAIQIIKDWLSNRLKGSSVDGLPDVKVIA